MDIATRTLVPAPDPVLNVHTTEVGGGAPATCGVLTSNPVMVVGLPLLAWSLAAGFTCFREALTRRTD